MLIGVRVEVEDGRLKRVAGVAAEVVLQPMRGQTGRGATHRRELTQRNPETSFGGKKPTAWLRSFSLLLVQSNLFNTIPFVRPSVS